MKVLVLYNDNPVVDCFVLTDPTEEQLDLLEQAHGEMIQGGVNEPSDGAQYVLQSVQNPEAYKLFGQVPRGYMGQWHRNMVQAEDLNQHGPFDRVFFITEV